MKRNKNKKKKGKEETRTYFAKLNLTKNGNFSKNSDDGVFGKINSELSDEVDDDDNDDDDNDDRGDVEVDGDNDSFFDFFESSFFENKIKNGLERRASFVNINIFKNDSFTSTINPSLSVITTPHLLL